MFGLIVMLAAAAIFVPISVKYSSPFVFKRYVAPDPIVVNAKDSVAGEDGSTLASTLMAKFFAAVFALVFLCLLLTVIYNTMPGPTMIN